MRHFARPSIRQLVTPVTSAAIAAVVATSVIATVTPASAAPARTSSGNASYSTVVHTVTATAKRAQFKTPSKNIYCAIEGGKVYFGARCDIFKHSFTAPPKPDSCHFDWGFALEVKVRAHWGCVSDAVTDSRHVPTLNYGDSRTVGRIECTSRRSGMSCKNTHSGHGFKLSRAKVRLF